MEQKARERMFHFQAKEKARARDLAVSHSRNARRHKPRQAKTNSPELEEIMVADEGDPVVQALDAKRHPKTVAEIFFQPGRSSEALGAVNDLGEAARP